MNVLIEKRLWSKDLQVLVTNFGAVAATVAVRCGRLSALNARTYAIAWVA